MLPKIRGRYPSTAKKTQGGEGLRIDIPSARGKGKKRGGKKKKKKGKGKLPFIHRRKESHGGGGEKVPEQSLKKEGW